MANGGGFSGVGGFSGYARSKLFLPKSEGGFTSKEGSTGVQRYGFKSDEALPPILRRQREEQARKEAERIAKEEEASRKRQQELLALRRAEQEREQAFLAQRQAQQNRLAQSQGTSSVVNLLSGQYDQRLPTPAPIPLPREAPRVPQSFKSKEVEEVIQSNLSPLDRVQALKAAEEGRLRVEQTPEGKRFVILPQLALPSEISESTTRSSLAPLGLLGSFTPEQIVASREQAVQEGKVIPALALSVPVGVIRTGEFLISTPGVYGKAVGEVLAGARERYVERKPGRLEGALQSGVSGGIASAQALPQAVSSPLRAGATAVELLAPAGVLKGAGILGRSGVRAAGKIVSESYKPVQVQSRSFVVPSSEVFPVTGGKGLRLGVSTVAQAVVRSRIPLLPKFSYDVFSGGKALVTKFDKPIDLLREKPAAFGFQFTGKSTIISGRGARTVVETVPEIGRGVIERESILASRVGLSKAEARFIKTSEKGFIDIPSPIRVLGSTPKTFRVFAREPIPDLLLRTLSKGEKPSSLLVAPSAKGIRGRSIITGEKFVGTIQRVPKSRDFLSNVLGRFRIKTTSLLAKAEGELFAFPRRGEVSKIPEKGAQKPVGYKLFESPERLSPREIDLLSEGRGSTQQIFKTEESFIRPKKGQELLGRVSGVSVQKATQRTLQITRERVSSSFTRAGEIFKPLERLSVTRSSKVAPLLPRTAQRPLTRTLERVSAVQERKSVSLQILRPVPIERSITRVSQKSLLPTESSTLQRSLFGEAELTRTSEESLLRTSGLSPGRFFSFPKSFPFISGGGDGSIGASPSGFKRGFETIGYLGFVKAKPSSKSKYVSVTPKPIPLNDAIARTLGVVDNTTSRSAKIVRTKKKVPETFSEIPAVLSKFRIGKKGQYVEKNIHSIDTLGEKQQLSVARFLARERRGSLLGKGRSFLRSARGLLR